MAKRRAESQIEAPGQDSFLDVVCNLVGILIVLVMLIAAQAKRGMIAAANAKPAAGASDNGPLEEEAKSAESTAAALEASINELDSKIDQERLATAMREEERSRFQIMVTVAEQRLAEYREQLSEDEKVRYDLQRELVASKGELASLSTTQVSLTKPKPHVLEHLPTPMARTVFGTEVHFRLLNHRLAYVPWDEVIEEVKSDVRNHLSKLRDNARVELSVREVAGFGAKYILRKAEVDVELRSGTARHGTIELERIFFVDVEPNIGQPTAQALGPGSEFRSRLAAHRPQNTAVTVWVYPDSFDDFRAVKAELFKLGFLTAARPMPMGEPIAGSPTGTRSSAE
jgi:hypothetical protein